VLYKFLHSVIFWLSLNKGRDFSSILEFSRCVPCVNIISLLVG